MTGNKPKIVFSHQYTKFRNCIHDKDEVLLVHVIPVITEDLPERFLEYDTHFTIEGWEHVTAI